MIDFIVPIVLALILTMVGIVFVLLLITAALVLVSVIRDLLDDWG